MARYRLVDGLRALAAGLVLLTHVAFWTGTSHLDVVGGLLARADSGVAIFFAISAFLLLRPWIRAGLERGRGPRARSYVWRRAVRILPAYWVALAAVLLVAGLSDRAGGIGSPIKVVLHALLLQGYTLDDYQAFSQTWSLTTEVTFYLFIPVVGVLLGRLARRGRAHLAVAVAAALGLAIQGVATWCSRVGATTVGGVLATSVAGHLAWFAAGASLALGSAGVTPTVGERVRRWWRAVGDSPSTLVALAGFCYLLASGPIAGPRGLQVPSVAEAVTKEALYAVIAVCLLRAAEQGPSATSPVAAWIARSPATRWLGDISYGVFLWHVVLLQVLYLATGQSLFSGGFWWMLVAVTSLTVLVAWASAAWLEMPLLAWIHRRTRTSTPPPRPASADR